MAAIIERLILQLGWDPSEVFKMAISVPADLFDRNDLGSIEERSESDLVVLSPKFVNKTMPQDEIVELAPPAWPYALQVDGIDAKNLLPAHQ